MGGLPVDSRNHSWFPDKPPVPPILGSSTQPTPGIETDFDPDPVPFTCDPISGRVAGAKAKVEGIPIGKVEDEGLARRFEAKILVGHAHPCFRCAAPVPASHDAFEVNQMRRFHKILQGFQEAGNSGNPDANLGFRP